MNDLDLFIRVNEGTTLTEEEVRELVDRAPSSSLAGSVLTLVALDRPVPMVESIAWYLNEKSVLLPNATLGWELPDAPLPDERSWLARIFGAEPSAPPQPKGFAGGSTFRVTIGNGALSWHERNLMTEQAITDFWAKGPPETRSPPSEVLERLRAIVGGRAGANRAEARERLLRKMNEPVNERCGRCRVNSAVADLRAGERLPIDARLFTVAYKTFPMRELRRCLACGAHFEFENDYEFGHYDTDSIRPISLEEAVAFARDAFIVA